MSTEIELKLQLELADFCGALEPSLNTHAWRRLQSKVFSQKKHLFLN